MSGPLDDGQRDRAKELWNRAGDDAVRIEGILFTREGDHARAEIAGEQLGESYLFTIKSNPKEYEKWVASKLALYAGQPDEETGGLPA